MAADTIRWMGDGDAETTRRAGALTSAAGPPTPPLTGC